MMFEPGMDVEMDLAEYKVHTVVTGHDFVTLGLLAKFDQDKDCVIKLKTTDGHFTPPERVEKIVINDVDYVIWVATESDNSIALRCARKYQNGVAIRFLKSMRGVRNGQLE